MAVLPLHGLLLMSSTSYAAIVSFTGDVQIANSYPTSAEETVFEDDSTLGAWEEAQVLTLPIDVEVDIAELGTYDFAPGVRLRKAATGKEPSLELALPEGQRHTLATRSLGSSAGDDLVVVSRGDGVDRVLFLVRTP